MLRQPFVYLIVSQLLLSASILLAEKPVAQKASQSSVEFAKTVAPIFKQHCQKCHGAEHREGGFRLLTQKDLLALNDSGAAAVVPGKSAKSELIRRITSKDDERMPPADAGERLSAKEIVILKKWIDAGAIWPKEFEPPKHWAYKQPQRPPLPAVKNKQRVLNAIDHFVLARLEAPESQLRPSPTAEPARLIRRVYLDLIGLPPTPEEVSDFVKNPTHKNYERIVDELLKSPRYGEKWAQQWLDLARYADSNGFQADQFRSVWPYRDWVINAMNADMPFDQFTIEQIAGDLLPNATFQQKIATGFHRCTTCNVEAGVDPEENRINQIVDRVNTTGLVWLGTTLECAQCHNHKYDPFTQQDYYQLFAFFNNTPLEVTQPGGKGVTFNFTGPKLSFPIPKTQQEKLKELKQQQKELAAAVKKRREELAKLQPEWEASTLVALKNNEEGKISDVIRDTLKVPAKERNTIQAARIKRFHEQQDETCAKLVKQEAAVQAELKALEPDTSLVMVEMDRPRMSSIFKRGNFLTKGPAVKPKTPQVLHSLNSQGTSNRLALAKWLVSEKNPLVSRVTVNRWWAEFFGHGIVTTEEDFGTQGDPPTHPQLLDWLAVEFMERGWSMKHIHKLIVMSATYQQSSKIVADQYVIDPLNRYYARGPRLRLSAETIRDNALAISGLLSTKMGGPPIYPPQPAKIWRHVGRNAPKYNTSTDENRFRRGIYVIWRRSAPYPSFTNFDAPDRGACVIKRSRTNTPLQALTLLNDPAYVEMAVALAKRLATHQPTDNADVRKRIEYGLRLCVAREPTTQEVDILLQLFNGELSRFKENRKAAAQLIPKKYRPADVSLEEMAAWFYVANILLNLDETITKG